jgi:hypothetical protein
MMERQQSPLTSSQQLSSHSPANPRPAARAKAKPRIRPCHPDDVIKTSHAKRPASSNPTLETLTALSTRRQLHAAETITMPPSAVCDARADMLHPTLSSCSRAILAESASQQFKQSCASSLTLG